MVRPYKPRSLTRCGGFCGGRANERLHSQIMRRFEGRESVAEIVAALGVGLQMVLDVIDRHSGLKGTYRPSHGIPLQAEEIDDELL